MLTTLLEPTSGTAAVAGFDVRAQAIDVRRNIGYVPENVQLYEALTAYENLEFFAKLSGISDPKNAIDETLEFLEATSFAHKKIGELSKGMRQRIGLAQAIIHKPAVLFLDEPSAGLDPTGIIQLREIILRLNKAEGTTIFMNTHQLIEVAKTCTAIGVLNHGKLVYTDTLANTLKRFKNEDSLEKIYFSIESDADDK